MYTSDKAYDEPLEDQELGPKHIPVPPGQHTPGPWMVRKEATFDKKLVVMDARQFFIASVHRDADEKEAVEVEEQAANARLIAKAPEMLALLKNALPMVIKLGDFIGNGQKLGPGSLGERCDLVLKLRDILREIGEEWKRSIRHLFKRFGEMLTGRV